MSECPYTVVARNASFQRIGRIDRLTRLEVFPRYNGVDTWTLSLAQGTAQAALLDQVAGVVIYYGDEGGTVLTSGPIIHLGESWDENDAGGGEDSEDEGTLTVSGVSDDIVIARAEAWPNPGSTIDAQTVNGYDQRSGAGETVIKGYVDANIGPSGQAARQVSGLTIEADLLRGSTVKGSARMKNLAELITELCVSADLGWRVQQVGTGLEFQIYEPADRTLTARLGRDLGNLVSYRYEREAPKVTRSIVGGGGEDVARKFRQVIDSASESAWGFKAEVFRDARHTEDNIELDQLGAEAIVEGGPRTSLEIQAVDTDLLRFNEHYGLGDKVTVEPSPGRVIQDVLREIHITWDAESGPRTTSQVGSNETSSTPRMIKLLAKLTKRVAELEAKK